MLSVLRHVSPAQLYHQQLPIRPAIVRQLLQAAVACTIKHLHGTPPEDGFGALLRCASILSTGMSSGSQQLRWAELACQVPGVQRFLHRCIAQLVSHCDRASRDWHQALGAAFDLLFDLMAAGGWPLRLADVAYMGLARLPAQLSPAGCCASRDELQLQLLVVQAVGAVVVTAEQRQVGLQVLQLYGEALAWQLQVGAGGLRVGLPVCRCACLPAACLLPPLTPGAGPDSIAL